VKKLQWMPNILEWGIAVINRKVKVGFIGCGKISAIYLQNCKLFDLLDVVAVADLDLSAARARAEEFEIPVACSVDELLEHPEIEIIVNLTIPKAHADVCIKALHAGKHVYVEKPLAVTREEGQEILRVAEAKGLRVASAPETFLGAGIQTCRKAMEDGLIGEPVAATAFMLGRGHEHWHPNPEFYYEIGGGPMFDMGPYYLTALVNLIGPIRQVTGMTRITFPERTISSQPKAGKKISVETPTHVAGLMEFENGAIGSIITSFDVFGGHTLPRIEIYGTEGTLLVPDPNTFGGPVKLRRKDETEWQELPLTHQYDSNARGIGVADLAYAIRSGRPHRANGELAYHVLEAMHGFHDSSEQGRHYRMESTCAKPAMMPMDLPNYTLDK
jgi:predicted dehydrogenase